MTEPLEPSALAFKERVIAMIRKTAEGHRKIAADYKTRGHHEEARVWSKITEALGNLGNRIERGEAD